MCYVANRVSNLNFSFVKIHTKLSDMGKTIMEGATHHSVNEKSNAEIVLFERTSHLLNNILLFILSTSFFDN